MPAKAALAGAIALALAAHMMAQAHAQSSLGIGTNEAMVPSTGLFAHWMNWINLQQQAFYRSLTGALKAMRHDRTQFGWMVGLSFLYGIFHAAGPGHGKAVISSYMLANEVALRRGILLSFVSAFLQALTAIVLMTLVFLVLRGTAITMTDASWFLEICSYALIVAFGAWLLWRKIAPRISHRIAAGRARRQERRAPLLQPALTLAFAEAGDARLEYDGAQDRIAVTPSIRAAPAHHAHGLACRHDPAESVVCDTCGHSHAPDPAMISGKNFSWRTAWSAAAAVGLRPCSGALIVLSFSFLNGLWAGGVLSVVAMALGTAITVSALAALAVGAKDVALRIAGAGRGGAGLHAAIEIGGAALVFLLGLVLLAASLSA